MPIALAHSAIDDLGALLGFAIGIGTGVERVLEDANDVAITDRNPIEGDHHLAVRRARKKHTFGGQRDLSMGTEVSADVGA